MQVTTESYGQRVRRLRLERALTQAELAKRAGLSHTAVIHAELETHVSRPSTVKKLARALRVQPLELTVGDAI